MFGMGDKTIPGTHVATSNNTTKAADDLRYVCYGKEKESPYLPAITQLISKDLSEPYSIYVYRYFLYQWGDLCFLVGTQAGRFTMQVSLTYSRHSTTKATSPVS